MAAQRWHLERMFGVRCFVRSQSAARQSVLQECANSERPQPEAYHVGTGTLRLQERPAAVLRTPKLEFDFATRSAFLRSHVSPLSSRYFPWLHHLRTTVLCRGFASPGGRVCRMKY